MCTSQPPSSTPPDDGGRQPPDSGSSIPAPRSRSLSIGVKLALATGVVLAVANGLLFWQLSQHERERLVGAKAAAAMMLADLFSASLSAPLDFEDNEAVAAEVAGFKTNAEVTCAVVWSGQQPDPSAALDRGGCQHLRRASIQAAPTLQIFDDRVEVVHTVTGRGRTVGRCGVVFSLAAENATLQSTRMRAFWFLLALAVATAGLLIFVSRRQILLPLQRLAAAARNIGRGRFDTTIQVTTTDEVGQLATAFNRMGAALADREQRLEAARRDLRDLFDHMRQGIVAFGRDGNVTGPASHQATRLFRSKRLEGKDIRRLLFGSNPNGAEAQAFDEWVGMAFSVRPEDWEEFAELAPKDAVLGEGAKAIPVELQFQPIVKNESTELVMVLATDVKKQRELEQTVASQEKALARNREAVRQLLAGGSQVFVNFIDTARERVERCRDLVASEAAKLGAVEVDEIFRHVHTIKGEARALSLDEVEQCAVRLEDLLEMLRSRAREQTLGIEVADTDLSLLLQHLRDAIDRAVELFVEESPIGRAALDQTLVQRTDLADIEKLAESLNNKTLSRLVETLASRPFGESVARLVDMAPTWAAQVGKRVRLDVEGRAERIPPKLAQVLPSILTILVRNSVAHGIEPPEAREAAGKSETGVVHLVAAMLPGRAPIIIVEDDGRGIDAQELAKRAAANGARLPPNPDLTSLLFMPGLSTADKDNALAGRGVGLSAARSDLKEAGYSLSVTSEAGKSTRFVLSPAEQPKA